MLNFDNRLHDLQQNPDQKKMKRAIIIGVVLVVLLLGGFFGFRMFMMMKMGGMGGFGGNFPTAVMAFPPRLEQAARTVNIVGTLKADQAIHVAAEIAGRIAAIPAQEGAAVKAGDILVVLDDQIAKADREDAEASKVLAEANYARAKSLANRKFGTERSKDEAYAAVRQAAARLDLAKAKLAKLYLTAPFDGVLGLRQQSVGAYVNPGEVILSLASQDPIFVDFQVPELKSAYVGLGQKVELTVDALAGRVFEGVVTAIEPQINANTHMLGVRAKLQNADGALKGGMFARVVLSYGEPQDVMVVPERALFLKGEDNYVYRIVDGKAVLAKVTLGERRVGEAEIISGIDPKDEIVTDGQIKLRPDGAVAILNKPNLPKADPEAEKKE